MKIFDAFTVYNELDLLEIRLTELYNYVDYFVIVEANTTFTNRPKSFYYQDNNQRYAQWADKIIHVRIDDMPGVADPWVNETFQRDAILRGLVNADDNDIVIISDVDEVPRPQAVELIRNSANSANSASTLFALRMPLFNFKFNYMRTTPGEYDAWALAVRKNILNKITPNTLRNQRFNLGVFTVIEHGGWHWSFLGNNDYLRDKAASFSHQEINTPDFVNNIDLEKSIANRQHWGNFGPERYAIVKVDDYFPASIKKYPNFILDNAETSAYNILPPYLYQ
jgi:hypothetical protein